MVQPHNLTTMTEQMFAEGRYYLHKWKPFVVWVFKFCPEPGAWVISTSI
jgi:hypothetical protein